MSKLRASLVEIFSRVIKINSSDEVYINDIDNMYPNRIEGIINNSPTAYKCADIFARFLCGTGLEDPSANVIVNKKKNYKVTDVVNLVAKSIAVQNGCYVHYKYGADFVPNEIDVLDYKKCRLSKIDDNGFSGKIIYKDWTPINNFGKKKKSSFFYPYNENKDIILAQMKADSPSATTIEDLVKGYRGQVKYLNLTPQYQYALSIIDSVYNDADTEYRLSLYVNGQMRNGFMDQTVILKHEVDNEIDDDLTEKIKTMLGAENSSKSLVLTVPHSHNLNDIFVVKQIPSSFKPELLDKISAHLQRNIAGTFNNVPLAFVGIDINSLFGDSGAKYGQMKDFYSEQTALERLAIENVFKPMNINIVIKPITSEKTSTFEQNLEQKLKSQTELKATVGGVTSLISLATSVSTGILDLESAVQIVIEMYGFDETTARKLIGTPKIVATI